MTTYILHTPAPLHLLHTLVASRARVAEGRTLQGEPDCFAGWFEPANTPDCLPNNLVESEDRVVVAEVADLLVSTGHQVVVTRTDRHGNDVPDEKMPSRYEVAHGH
jgi:hypothetical protein